ncbi:stage II sporulation protein M [Pontibacillus salicampi]|uniref:Stage II sporulation protein M n=1 Tax=Pontibacillus salicampi TaxID=1449801 RepID=A0ABV6LUG3_9BACI
MQYKQFVQNHREEWNQLETLITTLHKSKQNITADQLEHFQRLYQKVAQHFSYSQTYYPEKETTGYLNDLVAKSHNLLYRDQVSSLKQLRQFFGSSFIQLLAEQWKSIIIAMLLFILGAAGAYISVLQDPMHLYAILPESIATAIDPERIGAEGSVNSPVMSASIMTNNIQVAILAFASGITFGIFTVYLLVYNGIIIGALAALFWQYGNAYDFWAFIVPHGMIELTAIFIAGGAGLMMGYRLLVPGESPRSYQLKTQALRSVKLFLGTIPLFVIAGLIEGYITPAPISLEAKYAFAFVTVVGLIAYIAIGKAILVQKEKVKV